MKKSIYDSEWEVTSGDHPILEKSYYIRSAGVLIINFMDNRTLARYVAKLHNDSLKDKKNREELAELAKLERETDAR